MWLFLLNLFFILTKPLFGNFYKHLFLNYNFKFLMCLFFFKSVLYITGNLTFVIVNFFNQINFLFNLLLTYYFIYGTF